MTCQVLVWLFFIWVYSLYHVSFDVLQFCYMHQNKWRVWYVLKNISLCQSIRLSICRAKCKGSAWDLSWAQAQSACLSTAFASTKLYCFITEAMDCLKVSIYNSAVTQSWLHVNGNLSLTSYLLRHHVTSLVCMSVVKISRKFIRTTTVFCVPVRVLSTFFGHVRAIDQGNQRL